MFWPTAWRSARIAAGSVACMVVATSLAGCGGGTKPSADPAPQAQAAKNTQSAEPAADLRGVKATSRSERPRIGDIPLDVWLEDPLTEAARQGTAAKPAATAPAAAPTAVATVDKGDDPAPAEKPTETPAAATGGAGDWKAIIPAELIQDETKKIRNRLTDSLQSVGKYNAHYVDVVQLDGATLAALAGIAVTHPDNVSWKEKAKHVRDLAGEVSDKAKGLGAKPYEETQKAFEKLEQLLAGNTPADLAEAADEIPFSEVANRVPVMKRMLRADEWIRSNIKSEAIMKKEAETIIHEATLVAALTKVISTEGYGAADEEDYQNFSKAMVQVMLDMATAVRNEDFKAFSDANDRAKKACEDCHQTYRFEE